MSTMKFSSLCLVTSLLLCQACGDDQDDGVVGADGSFETLTLVSSGGMPWMWHDEDQCDEQYPSTVTVDANPAQVQWGACQYDSQALHTVVGQGTRPLSTDELETVREELRRLQISKSNICGFDKAVVTLDVQAHGTLGRYVDDFYACNQPPDGRTFVSNIDYVEWAVWKLVD
jgi:hypothetical protein